MPNWVRSELAISGDRVELDKFIKLARNDNYYYEEDDPKDRILLLDFNSFIPMPVEEQDNWYDWSCENWGTKWNAKEVELDDDNEDFILYRFETAWGRMSDQLFWEMKQKFPKLEFSFACEEEGHFFWSRTELDNEIHDYSYPSYDCENLIAIAKEHFGKEAFEDDNDAYIISCAIDDLVMCLMADDGAEILPNGNYMWMGKEIVSNDNREKEVQDVA